MSVSIGAKLTLTAIESWSVERHWRNAVIIAVVGTIAFVLAEAPTQKKALPIPQQSSAQGNAGQIPSAVNNSPTTTIQPITNSPNVTIVPTKLTPKITDEIEIIEDENSDTDFAKEN